MKRSLLVVALSLTGALLFTSVSAAATTTTTSSKVAPARDKKKPYKFKTTGTVAVPGGHCTTVAGAANCIPLKCPAGARDVRYCTKLTIASICTGQVRIVFKTIAIKASKKLKRKAVKSKTVSSKTVSLTAACAYSSSATISGKKRMRVSVSFGGNTILAPSKASTKSARSG